MEKYYKISYSELRELLHDSLMLAALESGGVDNWEWYGASISDFIENNNQNGGTLYDIIDTSVINDFEEIN